MFKLSSTDTGATNTLSSAIRFAADICVCFVERVTVLAMGESCVGFEPYGQGAMQVGCMGFDDEVIWPDTTRIVTRVADLESFRDSVISQRVSKTMRKPCAPIASTANPEVTVTRRQARSTPQPAFTRLVSFCPEPIFKRAKNHLWAMVRQRVAVPLPAAIVHTAPTTFLSGFSTPIDGACHV